MCLLALQCSTMGAAQEQQPAKRQQDQQAVPMRRAAAELAEQASSAPAAVLQHEASNGSSAAGVGTPPVCAGTPQKCDSDGSSLLLAADEVAGSGAGTAPSSAERGRQQQQGKLAARLQLLMNTWEEGRSGSSSAQPSPGATAANGTGSPQRHHLLMGGSTPHSPLSGAPSCMQQQPTPAASNGPRAHALHAVQVCAGRIVPAQACTQTKCWAPHLSRRAEDTLSSLMGAFQPEGEDALRGLDPADAGTPQPGCQPLPATMPTSRARAPLLPAALPDGCLFCSLLCTRGLAGNRNPRPGGLLQARWLRRCRRPQSLPSLLLLCSWSSGWRVAAMPIEQSSWGERLQGGLRLGCPHGV